jgi:hypothetical protein
VKLALLGADSDMLDLLRTLAESADRIIVAYGVPENFRQPIQDLSPLVQFRDDWEALLHESVADALIVASRRGSDVAAQRSEQLRKVAQSGMPLLVIHPACEAIVVYSPDKYHPALETIHKWASDPAQSPLGQVEQVIVERELSNRDSDELRHQLARDMELLRRLVGEVRRVNALGGALAGGPFHFSVHVEGRRQILGRWSLAGGAAEYAAEIRVIGSQGAAVSRCGPGSHDWSLVVNDQRLELPRYDARRAALDQLRRAVSEGDSPESDWMAACRAQEIAEAAERSVQRGRTVELLLEDHSEEGTFKGVMAAGSCLLLMLSLVFLVIGAAIEYVRLPAARDQIDAKLESQRQAIRAGEDVSPPPALPRGSLWFRLWPTYPLVLFLLLQGLKLVFRPPVARPAHTIERANRR